MWREKGEKWLLSAFLFSIEKKTTTTTATMAITTKILRLILVSFICAFFKSHLCAVSLDQPGDLYIEKLLTHTIKAQSNIKLKVQENKARGKKMCFKIRLPFFLHLIAYFPPLRTLHLCHPLIYKSHVMIIRWPHWSSYYLKLELEWKLIYGVPLTPLII